MLGPTWMLHEEGVEGGNSSLSCKQDKGTHRGGWALGTTPGLEGQVKRGKPPLPASDSVGASLCQGSQGGTANPVGLWHRAGQK